MDRARQSNHVGISRDQKYFLLAGLNLLWIPIICLFYPETADRSLESIDAMFSTKPPFYWNMEAAYRARGDVLKEHGGQEAVERKTSIMSLTERKVAVRT